MMVKSAATATFQDNIEALRTLSVIWIIHTSFSKCLSSFGHLIIKKANELNKELNENKQIEVIIQN